MVLAFGKPKMPVHRESQDEFKRAPRSKIAIVNGLDDVMEATRLAPSANNSQSWFFIGDGLTIHAYSERSIITGRLNQINVGIALCHMYLAIAHMGKEATFKVMQKGNDAEPEGYDYTISLTMV